MDDELVNLKEELNKLKTEKQRRYEISIIKSEIRKLKQENNKLYIILNKLKGVFK